MVQEVAFHTKHNLTFSDVVHYAEWQLKTVAVTLSEDTRHLHEHEKDEYTIKISLPLHVYGRELLDAFAKMKNYGLCEGALEHELDHY